MIEQGRQNFKKLKESGIAKSIHEIWSNGLRIDKDAMEVIREEFEEAQDTTGKKRKRQEERDLAIRSKEWEHAIDLVHTTVSSSSFSSYSFAILISYDVSIAAYFEE